MTRQQIQLIYSNSMVETTNPKQSLEQSVPAKQFEIIESGDDFHKDLRSDIAQATQSIDMQFYIFEGDKKGIPLFNDLEQAARRGVHVRLLLDHYLWIKHPFATAKHLRRIRMLHKEKVHINTHLAREGTHAFWRRDHKKNVIIDSHDPARAIAYVGGRNISERDSQQHDFMLRVRGSLTQALQDDFDNTWHQKNSKEVAYINEGSNVLISDSRNTDGILEAAQSLMKNARKRVWIQTPYYDWLAMNKFLYTLRKEKPDLDIRVIMPQPKLNNHFIYRIISRLASLGLRRNNIDVYWYQKIFSHTKLMLVDDIAIIGSSNFNRSPLGGENAEIELISPDQALVHATENMFKESMNNSLLLRRK